MTPACSRTNRGLQGKGVEPAGRQLLRSPPAAAGQASTTGHLDGSSDLLKPGTLPASQTPCPAQPHSLPDAHPLRPTKPSSHPTPQPGLWPPWTALVMPLSSAVPASCQDAAGQAGTCWPGLHGVQWPSLPRPQARPTCGRGPVLPYTVGEWCPAVAVSLRVHRGDRGWPVPGGQARGGGLGFPAAGSAGDLGLPATTCKGTKGKAALDSAAEGRRTGWGTACKGEAPASGSSGERTRA